MHPNRPVETPAFAEPELRATGEDFRLVRPLAHLIRKANLIAILLFLIGGIYCASLVGMVIGWAPIRLGLRIRKLTQQFDDAFQAKDASLTQTMLVEIDRLIRVGDLVVKSLTAVAIVTVGGAFWLYS